MSTIGAILGTAPGIAANSNQGVSPPRGDSNSGTATNKSAADILQTAQPAAIVSGHAFGAKRASTSGEGRKADASFEKQRAKDKKSSSNSNGSGPRKSVNVSA